MSTHVKTVTSTTIVYGNTMRLTAKTTRTLAGVALACASVLVMPANATTNDKIAAERLNNILSQTKSLSANFVQTTTGNKPKAGSSPLANSLSSATRKSTGVMKVARPSLFRWEIQQPFQQLIAANQDSVWIYEPSFKQVTRQNVDTQMGNTPALLLSGQPEKISANFDITQPDPKKNYYLLKPKENNAYFTRLGIGFYDNAPTIMVLWDASGQKTTIKFSKVTRNASIPESQFQFTPPSDVEVIDQT